MAIVQTVEGVQLALAHLELVGRQAVELVLGGSRHD